MELYEFGTKRYSSGDFDVLQEDLSKFANDFLKPGGTFATIDKDKNGFLTIPEIKGFTAARATPAGKVPQEIAAAVEKSSETLANLNWDNVLFGPQISKKDIEALPTKMKEAVEKVKHAEQVAAVTAKHFCSIKKSWQQVGLQSDEISEAQLKHYIKTAELDPTEKSLLQEVSSTSMLRLSKIRRHEVTGYPKDVLNNNAPMLETGVNLWKDLPEKMKSYVPDRPAQTMASIIWGIGRDLIQINNSKPAPEHMDRAAKNLEGHRPRLNEKSLDDLMLAAVVDPAVIKTARFQKLAAMAGGPYDPSFTEFATRKGIADSIKNYFENYKKHGVIEYDEDLYGPGKK